MNRGRGRAQRGRGGRGTGGHAGPRLPNSLTREIFGGAPARGGGRGGFKRGRGTGHGFNSRPHDRQQGGPRPGGAHDRQQVGPRPGRGPRGGGSPAGAGGRASQSPGLGKRKLPHQQRAGSGLTPKPKRPATKFDELLNGAGQHSTVSAVCAGWLVMMVKPAREGMACSHCAWNAVQGAEP